MIHWQNLWRSCELCLVTIPDTLIIYICLHFRRIATIIWLTQDCNILKVLKSVPLKYYAEGVYKVRTTTLFWGTRIAIYPFLNHFLPSVFNPYFTMLWESSAGLYKILLMYITDFIFHLWTRFAIIPWMFHIFILSRNTNTFFDWDQQQHKNIHTSIIIISIDMDINIISL